PRPVAYRVPGSAACHSPPPCPFPTRRAGAPTSLPRKAYLGRVAVIAQSLPGWLAEPALGAPRTECHLGDELRAQPYRIAGVLAGYRVGERCGGLPQRVEALAQNAQRLVGQAGADLADVAQPAVRVVHAEQQRADRARPPARARPVPADDDLGRARERYLDPGRRAPPGGRRGSGPARPVPDRSSSGPRCCGRVPAPCPRPRRRSPAGRPRRTRTPIRRPWAAIRWWRASA